MARPRRQTNTMKQYLDNEREGYISNDADTQRNPAWKPIVDGLAVTILTDDYVPVIILAEEDSGETHIVDGGSRTAAFKMIRYGNYKIKSSVDDPIIKYKSMTKDENGKTVWSDAEFDIRNKTFDQFPKELQKKFDEYQVDMVVHEHCTKEDIAKYIRRYNIHKSMTANQKGFLYLERYAEQIRNMCKKSFFINNVDISDTDKENGLLERVLSESVMCMFHLSKWNKNGKKLATYLNENATTEEFEKLNENIGRLENIVNDKTKCLFNTKDTFIWLTLFNTFTELGYNDEKFGNFLSAFVGGLRNTEVDGKLFDEVDKEGSTKDKKVIIAKLHILETLMFEFLHIKKEDIEEVVDEETFVSEVVGIKLEDLKEDIDLYRETLEDLKTENIKDGSKLLDERNNPSLLAMVAYSYKVDKDLDAWMNDYAKSNNTYFVDQKKNYLHMKKQFDQFCQKGVAA